MISFRSISYNNAFTKTGRFLYPGCSPQQNINFFPIYHTPYPKNFQRSIRNRARWLRANIYKVAPLPDTIAKGTDSTKVVRCVMSDCQCMNMGMVDHCTILHNPSSIAGVEHPETMEPFFQHALRGNQGQLVRRSSCLKHFHGAGTQYHHISFQTLLYDSIFFLFIPGRSDYPRTCAVLCPPHLASFVMNLFKQRHSKAFLPQNPCQF